MTEAAGSTLAERQLSTATSAARKSALFGDPRALLREALAQEIAERRFFLWLPVAAGAGVVCSIYADHEPSLIFVGIGLLVSGAIAFLLRHRPLAFAISLAVFALFLGFASAGWRAERVAAPVLPHLKIATIEGFIEEMDFRETGARFVLRPRQHRWSFGE